ncbi:AAA family ATPase [Prosthecobacter sp.]|uniref:AAA family ATPase n=1 Tax=Prosthecobacter sp. TaxID=1965333 RepID=UPI0037836FDD
MDQQTHESLDVSGFAGLNNIRIELEQFNLLIGPQATGKSILAKLLFYFKGVIWHVFTSAQSQQPKRELDQGLLKRFEELFPPQSWGKNPFSICYRHNELHIEITREHSNKSLIQIHYSKFFHTELIRIKKALLNSRERSQEDEFERYQVISRLRESLGANAREMFGPRASLSQLFIPAGRSFFANLQSSIFTFLSGNNAIDPFLKEFGSFYENIKRTGDQSRRRTDDTKNYFEETERLIQEILCGKYVTEKGRDYLDVVDGRRINLGNCSSGQQETLPLALILKRLPFLRGKSGGYSVYIEEPEAHLFPTAQRLILELIALAFNAAESRVQVIITTHSPYVLTALNNLIQAGALYSKAGKNQMTSLSKLVPKSRAIPISSVAAYSLTRKGCESIIDADTELLKTELIDHVSTDLAVQFDELLNLE